MTRTIRGSNLKNRHKKLIKFNKGYRDSYSKLFKVANQKYMKALSYSYSSRRKKKSNFRQLWIKKITGYLKEKQTEKYNIFIKKLKENQINLNRKIIALLCENDNKTINKILELR